MFHNQKTRLPQGPPRLSQPFLNIDLTTFTALHATWNGHSAQRNMSPRFCQVTDEKMEE